MNNDLRLLIPINIEALAVDNDQARKAEWVDLKPDFRGITRLNEFLGSQMAQGGRFSSTKGSRKAGVHLHWALPDGLLHSSSHRDEDGSPEFAGIPNRWLVVRFWDQAPDNEALNMEFKAWLIESDTVVDANESSCVWPTLNSASLNREEDYFVYVGKVYNLEEWPGETEKKRVNITAIGYGDPSFAAYYPACKSILAFYDHDFSGVREGATLNYLVTGWYADASDDPLQFALRDADTHDRLAIVERFFADKQWFYPGLLEIAEKMDESKQLRETLKDADDMLSRLKNSVSENDINGERAWEQKIFADANRQVQLDREITDFGENLPTGIVCHGLLTGLQWRRSILSSVPKDPPFKIAIGETAVEALSVLLSSDTGDLGDLLASFQYDLLEEFEKPGGAATVSYKLHERGFKPSSRGIRWDVVQENPLPRDDSDKQQSTPIPGDIRGLLENLNQRQRRINQLWRERDGLRSQLYATWYKKNLNAATSSDYQQQQESLLQDIRRLNQRIEDLQIDDAATGKRPRGSEWNELRKQIARFLPGWSLKCFDEIPFWRPNDPYILLAGPAFRQNKRHGEDGRFSPCGRLLCRLSNQTIAGINIKIPYAKNAQSVEFGRYELDQFLPLRDGLKRDDIPAELADLIREAHLLALDPKTFESLSPPYDPACLKKARTIVETAYEKNEPGLAVKHSGQINSLTNEFLTGYLKIIWDMAENPATDHQQLRYPITDQVATASWELLGTFPSPLFITRWKKNPWIPLFLRWQVSWKSSAQDTAHIFENWQLNERGTVFARNSGAPVTESRALYEGTSLLGPTATKLFRNRLRQYNLTRDVPTLKQFETALYNADILGQSLGGFTDQLLMRKAYTEIHPLERVDNENPWPQFSAIFDEIKEIEWLSPMTEAKFFPLRAGELKLHKLWVVDAFGQVLKLESKNPQRAFLRPKVPKNRVGPNDSLLLEPRLAQASRISLSWRDANCDTPVSEDKDQADTNNSFNPICGWILPNFLDQSLLVYDAAGYALGALQAVQRKSWGQGAGAKREPIESFHWLDIPGSVPNMPDIRRDKNTDPLPVSTNKHLREFVNHLLTLQDGKGQTFAELMNRFYQSATAGSKVTNDNANLALLIGKPAALVRASIRLEFDGRPACSQGMLRKQDDTGGIETFELRLRLGDRRAWRGTWLSYDGLLGFFVGQKYDRFYPAFGASGKNDAYHQYGFTPALSVNEPVDLTLLMDPSRGICATCGILPRSHFSFPYGDSQAVLDNKQIIFSTGPVISPDREEEIHMPQPSDLFGQWSWTHHPKLTEWGEKTIFDVQKQYGHFSGLPNRIQEGWLKLLTAPLQIRTLTIQGKIAKTILTDTEIAAKQPPTADRFEIDKGETLILTWSLTGADSVRLQVEREVLFESHQPPLPNQYAVRVDKDTAFTLSAADRNGNTRQQTIFVSSKEIGDP
ncbi:MAG: hypothetical protein BVN35_08125 [Proteobacteria bacterium ST_bin11]|nr:MAG: hypothetical protein BVN35_08125 [Proteobacteria bacterium ST_bin11]